MKKFVKILGEAIFPQAFTCDICGIETFGENLCSACVRTVTFNDFATCPVCGRKTVKREICMECKAKAPLYKKAVSPLIYEGGAVVLISKFKKGEGYLKDYFADLIVEKLGDMQDIECIVYVPMTEKAEYKRGYNQAELLAKSISERIAKPVIKDALLKVKETSEQKSLTQKERAENLKGCFKVNKRNEIKDKTVLLVDDILTTGATAEAVCERLLKAGAKRIYFATVASVQYKSEKLIDKPLFI